MKHDSPAGGPGRDNAASGNAPGGNAAGGNAAGGRATGGNGHPPVIEPHRRFSGAALRDARRHAGISLRDVSGYLQKHGEPVSTMSLSRWERGQGEPPVTVFYRICYFLRHPPGYFLRSGPSGIQRRH